MTMADLKNVYRKPLGSLDDLGGQLAFHIGVLRAVPRSVTRYPKEILRILAEGEAPAAAPAPAAERSQRRRSGSRSSWTTRPRSAICCESRA